MSVIVKSMVNVTQTLDGVDLGPFRTQTRVAVTAALQAASDLRQVQLAVVADPETAKAPGVAGNKTLAPSDVNGITRNTSAAQITVPLGLGTSFSHTFTGVGVLTFVGAATVNDYRQAGAAHPACTLLSTDTVDVFDLYGSKP
jgi:hypothetical protein